MKPNRIAQLYFIYPSSVDRSAGNICALVHSLACSIPRTVEPVNIEDMKDFSPGDPQPPGRALHMPHRDTGNPVFHSLVAELRRQGLIVSVHHASNETWFIKGSGLYNGYVATGSELQELKRTNELNISGIKSLG